MSIIQILIQLQRENINGQVAKNGVAKNTSIMLQCKKNEADFYKCCLEIQEQSFNNFFPNIRLKLWIDRKINVTTILFKKKINMKGSKRKLNLK